MEKCTYCVQRINEAKIAAKRETAGSASQDGESSRACQQACPTAGHHLRRPQRPERARSPKRPRDRSRYTLLEELNVRPRTTYLGKIRNPNPELEGA